MDLEIPEPSDVKLITMTINMELNIHINLDVAVRFIPLDDEIVGKVYGDYYEGKVNKKKQKYPSASIDDITGGFKNQCTFIINVGDKNINTKVFNNGKLVNVGCKKIEHVYKAAEILVTRFHNLSGCIRYPILQEFPFNKGTKKYFKDELRKRWGDMLMTLINYIDYPLDMSLLSNIHTADQAYKQFTCMLEEDPCVEDKIMYLMTLITLLRHYFPEKEGERTLVDFFDTPDFQSLLSQFIENTVINSDNKDIINITKTDDCGKDVSPLAGSNNREDGDYIEMVFPCYLHEEIPIKLDYSQASVHLINHVMNCNFLLDRIKVIELLKECDQIDKHIKYDPETYPGVIAQHKSTGIKIIFFNTGKINITAAKTFEQVQIIYQFVKDFCHDNYEHIVRQNGYINKQLELLDEMPNQLSIGTIYGKQYHILKKSHILTNPRNIYLLKKFNLIDKYDESESHVETDQE